MSDGITQIIIWEHGSIGVASPNQTFYFNCQDIIEKIVSKNSIFKFCAAISVVRDYVHNVPGCSVLHTGGERCIVYLPVDMSNAKRVLWNSRMHVWCSICRTHFSDNFHFLFIATFRFCYYCRRDVNDEE